MHALCAVSQASWNDVTEMFQCVRHEAPQRLILYIQQVGPGCSGGQTELETGLYRDRSMRQDIAVEEEEYLAISDLLVEISPNDYRRLIKSVPTQRNS